MLSFTVNATTFHVGLSGRQILFTIVNVAAVLQDWRWVADSGKLSAHHWHFESALPRNFIERRFPFIDLGRLRSAFATRRLNPDIVFSHGPWITLYTAFILSGRKKQIRHIAMSFNFTDLPSGKLLWAMRRFFPKVERFVVFSQMERVLYSELFNIPIDRFDFIHWGVNPPINRALPVKYVQPYLVALGGEARDYDTIIEAARLRPNDRFVIIARPHSVKGELPSNVSLRINVTFDEAWSTVWHAYASLISLRSAATPNGHVTLVGSMLLGKAIVITDSTGVHDYVSSNQSALLVPAASPKDFANAIAHLLEDRQLGLRLGQNARHFAEMHCTEGSVINYIEQVLAIQR